MAQAKTPEGVLFSIHLVGDTTGKLWTGEFRAKPVLTFRDKLQSDRMKRDMLGGDGAGASAESIVASTIIGDLTVRLTETPEWWKESQGGLGLQDYNVLEAVYEGAKKVEKEHVKAIEEAGKKAEAALRDPPEKK
jgi:hypothetical protein